MGDEHALHTPQPVESDAAAPERVSVPNSALVASGRRQALDHGLRASMEAAFRADLSGVRVHEGGDAAGSLGAIAFTRGDDIHFAPGQYRPGTESGNRLLAHELTHVLQQRAGRVKATQTQSDVPLNDDPALEQEADQLANDLVPVSERA